MSPDTASQSDAAVPSDGFQKLVPLASCRLDEGTFVEMGGREFAVFRMSDPPAVHVLDNACPHANGNLSAGRVKDGVVNCPWHGWRFRLCDGRSPQGSVARVETYPVEIRGEDVYVKTGTSPDQDAR